jgi:hypothetical protein
MWSNLSENKKIALLLLAAVTLTTIVWLKTEAINDDGVRYIHCAQSLKAGEWQEAIDHEKMPFMPTLICAVQMLVSDWVTAGRIVAVLANLLLLLPFYYLCRKVWDADKAFISTLFLTVAPYFRTVDIMRDPLFLLFLATFLYFWLSANVAVSGNGRHYAVSVACALLAALSRIEGFFLLLLSLLFLIGKGLRSASRRLRYVTAMLLLCATLAGGYAFLSQKQRDYDVNRLSEFTNIVKHPVHYYQTSVVARLRDKLAELQPEFKDGKGGLLETTRNFFWLVYLVGLISVWVDTTFAVMFFLAMIGLYAGRPYQRAQKWLLLWLLLFLLIPYLFLLRENFLSGRYLCPASLILYAWIGPGFCYVWQRVRDKFTLGPRSCLLLLLVLLAVPVCKIVAHHAGREGNISHAGAWVKQNNIPAETVVTNEMKVLFYADIPFHHERSRLFIKGADLPTLRQRAQELHARWVVYKCRHGEETPQGYLQLFPGKRSISIYKTE